MSRPGCSRTPTGQDLKSSSHRPRPLRMHAKRRSLETETSTVVPVSPWRPKGPTERLESFQTRFPTLPLLLTSGKGHRTPQPPTPRRGPPGSLSPDVLAAHPSGRDTHVSEQVCALTESLRQPLECHFFRSNVNETFLFLMNGERIGTGGEKVQISNL